MDPNCYDDYFSYQSTPGLCWLTSYHGYDRTWLLWLSGFHAGVLNGDHDCMNVIGLCL